MGKNLIYLLTCILFSEFTFAQNTFPELISSGNLQIKDKNYKVAIDYFNQANSIQPNDTAALNGLIKAYTLSENYKEAQKQIDEALKNYPSNPEFVLRQGILYNLSGDHERAIEEFTKALELNPPTKIYLQVLLNKASAAIRLEDYANALSDYNKAIEIDPRSSSIYNYRGLVNFKLAYYLDAINDYNNAINLEPEAPLTYYNRGMSFYKLSEMSKACADFHKSCKLGNMNACKMIIALCGGK